MRKSFQAFAVAGLAASVAALAISAALAQRLAENLVSIIIAVLLVIGLVASALWAAGPQERKTRAMEWVRCGLVAAVLTFIVMLVVVIPALLIALNNGGGAPGTYLGVAVALIVGLVLIWLSLRLAWRRAAPKAGV